MGHRGGVVTGVGLLLAAGVVVLAPSPVAASACTFDQVTHDDGIVVRTATNGDGSVVVFSSTSDLTGGNADRNLELFLWDADAPNPSQPYEQLTDTAGSDTQPFFAMDDSGNRIAVVSPRNLHPPDNNDLNSEVFLYDRTLDTFVQLTVTTGTNVNRDVAISGDGNRIAFVSIANPIAQNADGNAEVFLRTLQPNSTVQVTNTTGGGIAANISPALDHDGDRVAFLSNRNLAGQNPSNFGQVFVRDLTAGTFAQVTHTPVEFSVGLPDINANGAFVSYSTSTVLAGPNSDLNGEFYRTRVANGTTVRLTDGVGQNTEGRLTGAGDRIIYRGQDDLAEGGMTILNVSTSDVGGSRTRVVDPAGSGVEGVSSSADGTTIAFQTTLDLIGQNDSHRQALFVATCGPAAPIFTDVPRTNPFFDQIQWLSETGVANGFPNGTFDPLGSVKRQQMANFLFNLAGNPLYTPPSVPDFRDVPTSHAFFQAIEWMYEFGVAGGFPDGTFRPEDPVKRQQMANFLYNLAGEPAFTPPATPTFDDVPTSNPFFAEIEWMAELEIAAGFPDGTFLPQAPVKRQQMANFVYRFRRAIDLET